jgi:hypothetical protein
MSKLPPDPGGIFEAVRHMGYGFHEAVADVIDNSIDASATSVLVRLSLNDGIVENVDIADNGHGMTSETMAEAMIFGRPKERARGLLGKYGLGMKAATFSQAESLTVASRQHGEVTGRRWTEEGIRNEWDCEIVPASEARQILNMQWEPIQDSTSGTVIRWGGPRRFAGIPAARASAVIDQTVSDLLNHLGLVLHRFLQGDALSISIEVMEDDRISSRSLVEPLDPFGYRHSGDSNYPVTLKCEMRDLGSVSLKAHVWPPNSNARGYKLGGGAVAQRQGFYFYRNNRLIQSGGWNDWRNSSEPHLSLARVEIDLPTELDDAFSLNTQKHGVHPPTQFFEGLKFASDGNHNMAAYIAAAQTAYRAKPPTGRTSASPCVPASGLDSTLLEQISTALAPGGDAETMELRWEKLPGDRLFAIEADTKSLIINTKLRRSRATHHATQPPVMTQLERMLLFLLLRDEIGRRRKTTQSERWNELCQELLTEAAKRAN